MITRLTLIGAGVAFAIIVWMFVCLNVDPLAGIVAVPMSNYRAPASEPSWEEDTSWLQNAA